jgi:hypothetical protein
MCRPLILISLPTTSQGKLMSTTTIDFKDLIDRTLGKMLSENALETQVQAHVETMLKKSVDELFRSYGPITKQIEQQLADSINLNGLIDIQSYNGRLAALIQTKMDAILADESAGRIAKVINDALEPAPKAIKISELVEQYVADLKEAEEGSCSCGDKFAFVELKDSEATYLDGYYQLILSKEKPGKYGQPDIYLAIDKNGRIYHSNFRGEVVKWMTAGVFGDFEKSLWRMAACGTVIERDCDPSDCDLGYSDHHD